MGRSFDKDSNEVKYLVRDTHGPACLGHEHGTFPPYDPRLKCVGGYLQVPESAIYKALVSYTYYVPKDQLKTESDPSELDDEDQTIQPDPTDVEE